MNGVNFLTAFEAVQERLRLRDQGIEVTPIKPKHSLGTRRSLEMPSKKATPLSWLKAVTSGLDIGREIASKTRNRRHPIHLNSNVEIRQHFEQLRWGSNSWLKNRWSNEILTKHCNSCETFYFSGSSESYKPFTLIMIDVDCHNHGSLEGALSFLQYLRQNYFHNLYFEPSTNGNGGHGYLILDKEGLGSQGIKSILSSHLEPWLNDIANEFDVEFVEIKGQPPELTWGSDHFELQAFKSGVLAKVPRGLIRHFDELKNTTVVTSTALQQLPSIPKRSNSIGMPVCSLAKSVSGCHFQTSHFEALNEGGKYYSVAAHLMSGETWKTCSRAKVSVKDMAIMLMIGEFFTNNMNSDGSMPTARWESLWQSLYQSGDIERGWDHKRFKLMRDRLSSLNLITWTDSSYSLGRKIENGEYVKGTAAKWKFSAELMGTIRVEVSSTPSSILEGEKKHPLWEPPSPDWLSKLDLTPAKEVIRPIWVQPVVDYYFSPDELTEHVTSVFKLAA